MTISRVTGTVGQGITRRIVGGAKGDALEEAMTGGGEWTEIVAAAAKRMGEADEEIARAAKVGARLIDVEDDEYPAMLRGITDPPPALFVKGEILPADARSAAVIGSRNATRYGIGVTKALVPPLCGKGVTIVSGMARGIDAAAHRAALKAGGRTIAVLGTGIDVPYPNESLDLYEEIPKRGAIVSESAPGTIALPHVFPPRNRIISGLAKVIVIVEARLRSGTSVTARHALDQGREVGVVPGDIDLMRSAGTNALLIDGAFPVRCAEDVLAHAFGEPRGQPASTIAPLPVPPGLDADTAALWITLQTAGASTLESLAQATGLRAPVVMSGIGKLERSGLVQGDGWGRFEVASVVDAR